MKKTLFGLSASLLLTTSLLAACSAQSSNSDQGDTQIIDAETPVPDFDTAAMDSLLSDAVERGEVVGVSALVYDEGQVVYEDAFGLGDRERNVPLTKDSVFRIYSMSKPITSAVIMDLVEESKISLDDPVSKYIPQLADMKVASLGEDGKPIFEAQATPMTVKDLLLHRAGLAYGIFGKVNPVEALYSEAGLFDPNEDLSVKMDKLSKLPLLSQPGTGWYYSYSIDVLGRIIEVVTGKHLSEVMKERIFEPLGMNETGFYVTAEQAPRFVSTYFLQQDGSYQLAEDAQKSPFLKENAFQSGGGGLVSTLEDYSKFAKMMLNKGAFEGGRILEPETVALMTSNQMDEDDIFMMPWLGENAGTGFGYGGSVHISATPEQAAESGFQVGQWGWGGAARTNFYLDPQNDAFGIIMLQFFGGPDPDIHRRFRALSLPQTKNTTEN